MKNFKQIVVALTLLSAALAVSACNTTRGFGQDVEKAGDEIQDAAD